MDTIFNAFWLAAFFILLVVTIFIGKNIAPMNQRVCGILIDDRGRYSLNHFQMILWTIVILSSVVGSFFANQIDAAHTFSIDATVWGLMGISATSGILAAGVKATKDPANMPTATAPKEPPEEPPAGTATGSSSEPRFAQIWLEEEGVKANEVINITKYQNFLFTLAILLVYIAAALKAGGVPKLPTEILWLIGISHAGYVGGKVPDKKV